MSERLVSTRQEELAATFACAVTALLVGLFGLRYEPPQFYFDRVPHAPELIPWWGRSVFLGGAGLLLLVALALVPFALRRRPLVPTARVYTLLELPPALGIPVASLLMALGALLALNPVARYAAYGWDTGRLLGEGGLGSVLVLSGLGVATMRRLTVVDRSAGRVTITWGKPLTLFRRTYDLTAARGVFLQTVHRTRGLPAFRVMLVFPKGRPIPLEVWWHQGAGERALREFSTWSGVPLIEPRT